MKMVPLPVGAPPSRCLSRECKQSASLLLRLGSARLRHPIRERSAQSTEIGLRLFVFCVFRLNANPAFSVRANVSGNIQSARVSVIHRAVAIPSFWLAVSNFPHQEQQWETPLSLRGTNITVVDLALLAFTDNDFTNFNMHFEVVIG